jgi:hypothetical protein
MPSVFNVQLSELGEVYQVINVILSEAKYILPTAKYIALPNQVALILKNELNQGKLISIEKDFVDKPKSKDIPLENFKIEEPKTLDQKKSSARGRVHKRMSAYTALLSAFDIFEFFMITGKLQARGFNVMDESNKETIYLSIIETGNEDLITDLERFLEIKDIFDRMMKKYGGLKQYFREINECDSEDELNEVVESNKGWLIN